MIVAGVPREELGIEIRRKKMQQMELDFTIPNAEAVQEKKKANDRQVGGGHYKDKLIQPWDVIDTLPHSEAIGFYRGNAIKYIMRAGSKGPAREDYEKAIHYLEKLLEIM